MGTCVVFSGKHCLPCFLLICVSWPPCLIAVSGIPAVGSTGVQAYFLSSSVLLPYPHLLLTCLVGQQQQTLQHLPLQTIDDLNQVKDREPGAPKDAPNMDTVAFKWERDMGRIRLYASDETKLRNARHAIKMYAMSLVDGQVQRKDISLACCSFLRAGMDQRLKRVSPATHTLVLAELQIRGGHKALCACASIWDAHGSMVQA